MRSRLCLAGVAMLLSVWPASAGAAAVDVASGGLALSAYHTYMSALVSGLPASQRNADAYVASISASCPNVLAPMSRLPVTLENRSAVLAFGEEMGFDAALAVRAPGAGPLAVLGRTLSRLLWSSPRTGAAVRRFLRTTRAFLTLAPSGLCGDARALASSSARLTPPGTLRFVARDKRVLAAAQSATSAFVKVVLDRFQTPADRATVADTNRLIDTLKSAYTSLAKPTLHKTAAALGLGEQAG